MLVLSRGEGEMIQIGDSIWITIVKVGTTKVRVGVEAPSEFRIRRIDQRDSVSPPGCQMKVVKL